jgi:hypothetical protein
MSRGKIVYAVNKESGNIYMVFNSQKEACEKLGLQESTIIAYVNNQDRPIEKNGFVFYLKQSV